MRCVLKLITEKILRFILTVLPSAGGQTGVGGVAVVVVVAVVCVVLVVGVVVIDAGASFTTLPVESTIAPEGSINWPGSNWIAGTAGMGVGGGVTTTGTGGGGVTTAGTGIGAGFGAGAGVVTFFSKAFLLICSSASCCFSFSNSAFTSISGSAGITTSSSIGAGSGIGCGATEAGADTKPTATNTEATTEAIFPKIEPKKLNIVLFSLLLKD